MENIRQALERSLAAEGVSDQTQRSVGPAQRGGEFVGARQQYATGIREVPLNSSHLQANRIISHLLTDQRAKPFDMLRTQVLQTMDLKGWRILAVTSPTPACGKTVTAVNLAISIARQPHRSVLLVDFDLQRPRVAASLGLKLADEGVLSVLSGQTTLPNAMINARIGDQRLFVLPTKSTIGSSELMGSPAMATLMQSLTRDYQSRTIIIDLPPILAGDDVIAILPKVDCVLLVASVGKSTVAEIEECSRHLQATEVVRTVVTKVPEASMSYYYY